MITRLMIFLSLATLLTGTNILLLSGKEKKSSYFQSAQLASSIQSNSTVLTLAKE